MAKRRCSSSSSLEAQVANLADEITYYSHDLDDGLDSGLLTEAQLERDIDCWKNASERIRDSNLPEECGITLLSVA